MNLALLLKLVDSLLASKPGSKGRAKIFSQAALLAICSGILFYSAKIPDQLNALNHRVERIEWQLHLASTNAVPGGADQLVTAPGVTNDVPSPTATSRAFTSLRKADPGP